MRKEKYIKDNLNEILSEGAPDILANILQTERVKDNLENDLRDEPLFLEEVGKKKMWIPAGIVTCMVALVLIVATFAIPKSGNPATTTMLCTITIDVNPSLDIKLDEEGNVTEIVANNDDGTEIAQKANKKLAENYSSEEIIKYITKKLEKEGYLDKDSSVMLVSTDKKAQGSSESLKNAKEVINKYKVDEEKKFVTVYQEYDNTKKVKALAEKKGISNAKAAYCIKVSEKTNKKVDDVCDGSLYEATSELMVADIDLGDEIEIEEAVTEEDTVESTDEELSTESVDSEISTEAESETVDDELIEEQTYISDEDITEVPTNNTEKPTETSTEVITNEKVDIPKEKKIDIQERNNTTN